MVGSSRRRAQRRIHPAGSTVAARETRGLAHREAVVPRREGDEENDPLIGLYGGAGEGLRTTTRDQGETNRSEGRSPLAGDSARSHRRQAGSDPSRESQLETERESVAPVLRILAGQELGVGAAAERDGGTRRPGVIDRAADQRQAPGQADETKSPCRQVRSRRIRSGRPASTMNGIAKQRKTGTSGGVEAEVLAPEGRADRSHRPLGRVLHRRQARPSARRGTASRVGVEAF